MNLKLFLEHLLSEQAIDEEVNLRIAQAPTASEQSSDLDEAAVGVAQARTEQLAIAIVPGSKGGKAVILYKPNEKLVKNLLSYMYRIKKPKSFTSLSNNHNKLMTQLKGRIPGFHPGNFLEVIARQAEDWATMRIY